MGNAATWSTSSRFDRGDDFAGALARYQRARGAALADGQADDAALERWGGAVDRVIATRAATAADLANKVRTMIVEGRGGAGCLAAILDDLDAMGAPPGALPTFPGSLSGEAVGHA